MGIQDACTREVSVECVSFWSEAWGRWGLLNCPASSEEEDLLGAGCQAEVLTVAKLTRESTNEIEAGHAAGKKWARRRSDLGRALKLQEQSAQRMMRMLQGTPALHADLWSDLSMAGNKGPTEDSSGNGKKRKGPGQNPKKTTAKKQRSISAYQAYVASNVRGRLANREDVQKYRQLSESEMQKYGNLAHAMTQRRRVAGGKRSKVRRADPLAWPLRLKRKAARRLQSRFDPKEARRQLQRDRSDPLWMRWQQISSEMDRQHNQAQAGDKQAREDFLSHVDCKGELWPLDPLKDHIFSWRIQRPPACSDPVPDTGFTSDFVQHTWMSKAAQDVACAPSITGVLGRSRESRLAEWERRHVVLRPMPGVKLAKESDNARAARAIRQAGLVLSPAARNLEKALANMLMTFAGQGLKEPSKVKSKQRLLLDENHVVVRLQRPEIAGSMVRCLWYQVCYLTYDRPVRATFLSLEEDTYLQPTTRQGLILAPKWKPGCGRQTWLFSLPELAASLVPSSNWTGEFLYIKGCGLGPEKEEADNDRPFFLDVQPMDTGPFTLDSVCTSKGPNGPDQAGSESDDDAVQTEALQTKARVSQAFKSAALDVHGMLPQEEVEDIIQRAAKGKTIQLADDVKVLFTFRQPSKQNPCGGFQVRCYCHRPDKKVNKAGTEYALACRRTMSIPGSGQAAETLKHLSEWALAGPNFESRVKHQAMPVPGRKTKAAKGTRSYELSDVPGDGDCLFTALGRELECKEKLIPGMRLPSGQSGSNMGPRWRSQLVQSVRRLASSRTQFEGLGISDWLQHSGWPDLESYIDGMTLAAENPEDPRQHWGGFLEATILCHATSPLVGCLLARQVREGVRCQAWCGAPFKGPPNYVAICWTGNHWQRLRLRKPAEEKLQEWFLSV
ncbi:unnamed protein product [Symbiodinium sp. CCMP2592]|nr:unnamed protein product [Symbiodinium sp. CCMP2592]